VTQPLNFAPPIVQNPLPVQLPPPPPKGPRWACPVKTHSNHELGVCLEFWQAVDNRKRRDLLFRNACMLCLGTNQGCTGTKCENVSTVPLRSVRHASSKTREQAVSLLTC
jgi:hypothetical protein